MSTDPFTLVYNKLWDMLEAHEGFAALVKPGNRIKFSGDNRDPLKREVASADLPEVRLVAVGGVPHWDAASNLTTITKQFELQIASGDKRYDAALFPVQWEALRAWSGWHGVLTTLIWNEKKFVELLESTNITEGVHEAELKRGVDAWTAVIAVQVRMNFTSSDLHPA